MGSPYTGNPTNASNSPAPLPGPGVLPIYQSLADGDPGNAATFNQGYKAAIDFIAWLMQSGTLCGSQIA